MPTIQHGIYIQEEATTLVTPIVADAGIPVIIGLAPVNQLDDPSSAVNVPILANSAIEAMEELGYNTDFSHFTCCQLMYVTANVYQVSPCVYINVLDPARHTTAVTAQTIAVSELQATLDVVGMLPSTVVVKKDAETTLVKNTDYTLAFTTSGALEINLTATGAGAAATSLIVSGTKLDPSKVTYEDIIGAYDVNTGKETGMQVVRQVYPKLGVIPGTLIAPGYSHIPAVGVALAAKAAQINGSFKAIAMVDLDTTLAVKYTDVKNVKENSGFTSNYGVCLWPYDKLGDYVFPKSVTWAALMSYNDANNGNIPSRSPSNKLNQMTGQCLASGAEVVLDQDQANTVNSYGVCTALNINGWRTFGNYMECYPANNDAKDMWIPVRRMFNWQGNTFLLTYFSRVDDPMNRRLIDAIIDSENIRCAAYAPDHWAGATIEYLADDNPTTDILAGKITFRQHIAPYTPAQTIINILNYDIDTLTTVLNGEG